MKRYLFIASVFIFIFGALAVQLKQPENLPVTQQRIVDLSGLGLKDLPDTYKDEILNAEVLILDRNYITALPEWMKEARNLKKISVNQNPDFDFFQFTKDFQDLNQLEEITASGCNVFLIPYQLTYFTRLKKLDLSDNLIQEIPYHFTFMVSLEACDFSNNRIKETGFALRDLQKMKSLDLSSNPVNTNFLIQSLAYREMDFLKLCFRDSLPEELSTLKLKKADFTFEPGTVSNGQLEKLAAAEFIMRSSEPGNADKEILNAISKNKNVTELSLVNVTMKEIPASIGKMAQLESLQIPALGLNSTTNLENFSQLNSLCISNNELSLSQIENLKKKLPNCTIQSDEEQLKGGGIALNITKPIENFEIPTDIKTIDPKSASAFVSSTGNTELKIPANAFLDAKGKPVTTPVEIQFTEYNDPVMVALSGIPMQIKNSDGSTGNFSSAGMFDLKATSNGKEVFPNPNALITANVFSKQSTPYNLYTFSEGKGWELAQAAPLIPAEPAVVKLPEEITNFVPTDYSVYEDITRLKREMADTIKLKRSRIYEPKVSINYKKNNANKNFVISFDHLPMYYTGRESGKNFEYNCPKEFDEVMNQPLRYNDYNYTAHTKVLDSIKKDIRKRYYDKRKYSRKRNRFQRDKFQWEEDVLVKDVSLTPDLIKDDYILRFNYRGRMHQFHVVPANEGKSATAMQKSNKKFFQNYAFASRLNKEAREKKLKEYNTYYETMESAMQDRYKKNKAEYDKKLKEYEEIVAKGGLTMEEYENRKNRESGMMYSFQVARFGLTNCDIVFSMLNPKKIKASFKDIMGKTLLFLQMFRIDKRLNAVTALGPGENLMVDYGHDETALMFILDDEHVGVVDSRSFANQRDNEEIEVKVYKKDEVNADNVRTMF